MTLSEEEQLEGSAEEVQEEGNKDGQLQGVLHHNRQYMVSGVCVCVRVCVCACGCAVCACVCACTCTYACVCVSIS